MSDLLSQAPSLARLAASVVIDELAALGVTEIVVCPGSRSAPLAYAAFAAEQAGRLRLWMRLDERAAGFFALGLAKDSGRAAAVVTTSGTAVANLIPALLEARHAHVPLLALTADRPATLWGTGANQTTDQIGLLGSVARQSLRIASADAAPEAWRSCLRRAVVAAEGRLSRTPGPVHLNIELTPPLTGQPGPLSAGTPFATEAASLGRAVALNPGPRTVVVAGDLPPEVGRRLAEQAARAGLPLLAEPSSNARRGPAAIRYYRLLLPHLAKGLERVLVFGHPTLSRPVQGLLGRRDLEIVAVAPTADWIDPGWAVSRVVPALVLPVGDPAWLARWQRADRELAQAIPAAGPGDAPLTGPALAAAVGAALGPADVLLLGASQPVRDADLCPVAAEPPSTYANRGLAGIDGTIATALGLAASSGRAVTALLGDLTALHDIGSLVPLALERPVDCRLVIADDNGGSIFATLEYGAPAAELGEPAEAFERCFALPHGVDLAAVARAFGCPAEQVSTAGELARALAAPWRGLSVIVAKLSRFDRREQEARLARSARRAARAGEV
ncbi:MAG: 2-succinyl-5-enolpyruvyl-6-hydroxy-3-cyclohexene-1-carboxylic-acid synthase [Propionibacteriaceae bacterium]|jgi:2-succinyl-5-enolpyruvyl-6-hydroxy-3-cyclohexene-1-carboxylate synthase|nr:2-succinyl-5-enolpyruvyl-6-hydroxy-3-cyclohexene-1-carboxylic-acid synthase [Propionibacteriaceae bacterium]